MIALLKRLKVLHPLTGILLMLMGALTPNGWLLAIGIGIFILCVLKK
jgi:hypothetical protein